MNWILFLLHAYLPLQITPIMLYNFCVTGWQWKIHILHAIFSPDSAVIGVLTSSMGWVGQCAFWSGHVRAAAGCCCEVLLSERGVFGASVLFFGAAVRMACALWSWAAGAGPGCCCRVLVPNGCLHLRKLGAAIGYCCQSGVCTMRLWCWCHWGSAPTWSMAVWALGPDGDHVFALGKRRALGCCMLLPKNRFRIFCYLGSTLAQYFFNGKSSIWESIGLVVWLVHWYNGWYYKLAKYH